MDQFLLRNEILNNTGYMAYFYQGQEFMQWIFRTSYILVLSPCITLVIFCLFICNFLSSNTSLAVFCLVQYKLNPPANEIIENLLHADFSHFCLPHVSSILIYKRVFPEEHGPPLCLMYPYNNFLQGGYFLVYQHN